MSFSKSFCINIDNIVRVLRSQRAKFIGTRNQSEV